MRLKIRILRNSLYFVFSLFLVQGCGLVTFSDASLPPDIKTFSVQRFAREVADGPSDMEEKFAEFLEMKIGRMTSLTREEKDGHIDYEGVIKSFVYKTVFSSKGGNDESPKEVERLTITIEVTYTNNSDDDSSFKKKTFSASADMLSTENKVDKEPILVEDIFRQLVNDIYSKSIDLW